ncbi:hypothetical protein B0H13DRAFT_2299372 [Mycena leptocephala]|nr:hypothetical protein B0H13DRAFT_2299372 [Mycena leptocephala]
MISKSQSDPSALGGRKRKAEAPIMYGYIMGRLRQEHIFSSIEEDDWDALTAKVSAHPQLPPPAYTSRPFTEATPLSDDLFGADVGEINVREGGGNEVMILDEKERSPDPLDVYDAVAVALGENVLWKAGREHLVMENQTSCRTAIDLILLTAIDLAQHRICESADVDEAVCVRHSLTGSKCQYSADGSEFGSWVVLHQEVDIPDQHLLPGTLSPFSDETQKVAFSKFRTFHRREGLPPPRRPPAHHRGDAPAGIWPALTTPVVPATSETKPFKAAATCDLNILQSRDLAIVLRLLTPAILEAPEDFERLAVAALPSTSIPANQKNAEREVLKIYI